MLRLLSTVTAICMRDCISSQPVLAAASRVGPQVVITSWEYVEATSAGVRCVCSLAPSNLLQHSKNNAYSLSNTAMEQFVEFCSSAILAV